MKRSTLKSCERINAATRSPMLQALLLGVVGAAPSVFWAVAGADFLTDDFGHALTYRTEGLFAGAAERSFESTGRPLVGFYYLLTFGLIGDHPATHALALGALNAVLVIAAWQVARRFVAADIAFVAALVLALVPNRASTHFWFSTGNYLLAASLALCAFGMLARHRSTAGSMVLFVSATLLMEGVVGLIAGMMVVWGFADVRRRAPTVLAVGFFVTIAASVAFVGSPKRSADGPSLNDSLSTLGHGLLGDGLWGPELGVTGAIGLLAVGVVAVARLLPSFHSEAEVVRSIQSGFLVAAVSAAPYLAGGSPFAASGIFDRTNAIPAIGVSLVVGTLLVSVIRWSPAIGTTLLATTCLWFCMLTARDLQDYQDAAALGERIIDNVARGVDVTDDVIVVPSALDAGNVAPFVYPSDLRFALRLRVDDDAQAEIPIDSDACAAAIERDPDVIIYDWKARQQVEGCR